MANTYQFFDKGRVVKVVEVGTPHTTCNTVCNAIRDWHLPGHHDLSTVIAMLASKIRANAALSDATKTSVVEMLDELADEIDQDLVNQGAQS